MNSLISIVDNDFNRTNISPVFNIKPSNLTFMERRVSQIVDEHGGKMPTLGRIKWGKRICIWAAIPCNFSFWMMPIGLAMQMPITPTLWAKGKLKDFHSWRMLR